VPHLGSQGVGGRTQPQVPLVCEQIVVGSQQMLPQGLPVLFAFLHGLTRGSQVGHLSPSTQTSFLVPKQSAVQEGQHFLPWVQFGLQTKLFSWQPQVFLTESIEQD